MREWEKVFLNVKRPGVRLDCVAEGIKPLVNPVWCLNGPGRMEMFSSFHGVMMERKPCFSRARRAIQGGEESRIRFDADGKSYYLYDSIIQHEDDKGGRFPVAEAGLKIVEGDRLISNEKCLDSTKTIGSESKQHMPEEDFNYDLP